METNDGMVNALAFAPDGKTIASGGKRAIQLWDVATGRKRRSFNKPGDYVLRLAFSPDGQTLASRARDDKDIRLWDVTTGGQIRRFTGPPAGTSLAFSPDGQTLAAGGADGAVRLWDVPSGEERGMLALPPQPGEVKRVFSLAFAPDGRTLAVGYGEGDNRVRLWELASGRMRISYEGHRGGIASLAFSPDGTLLASGGTDRIIMVWDVTGRQMAPHARKAPLRAEELNALWDDLGDTDARKAYRAVRTLLGAGAQAVHLLQHRLHPAAAINSRRIGRLLADLDSDEFEVRQQAARQLREMGDDAEGLLRKALAGKPSAEQRLRIKELLRELEVRSPERLRTLRAVEVLEQLGTAGARQVLKVLADGAPQARLTREATAALERLDWRGAN